jgi:hypothetical protein
MLVAREPEAYKPLLVEKPGSLLQEADAPLVDLDQVVVRAQHGTDFFLGIQWRDGYT